MSKKKKRIAVINELMANNKWEQVQRERDKLKVERIKNLGWRSKLDVLLGGLFMFAVYNSLLDIGKTMSKGIKASGAGKSFNFLELIKGIDPSEFGRIAIIAVIGLVFFFLAMSKNETTDRLSKSRYNWIPDKVETAFIEERFDNDFIRSILSNISSEDTYSIEAGLDAVTVNNNVGPTVFNFNKYGFNRLTNYDTKQLAYYLASHSFPDGFVIYQTKITPAGSAKFIGGTTDIGSDRPPAEDETKHTMKLIARVFEQLREFVRIKNPFKMYLKEAGPSAADNGHIVLNKGFKANKEGYKNI